MATERNDTLTRMLIEDGELRREFRKDPEAVIERLGVEMDDEMREALTSFDWDGESVELLERVSKTNDCCFASDERLKTNIRSLAG